MRFRAAPTGAGAARVSYLRSVQSVPHHIIVVSNLPSQRTGSCSAMLTSPM
jgi:hypothetical protein